MLGRQRPIAGLKIDPQDVAYGALAAGDVPAGRRVEPRGLAIETEDFRTLELGIAAILIATASAGNADTAPHVIRLEKGDKLSRLLKVASRARPERGLRRLNSQPSGQRQWQPSHCR